jgi:hypothetical protein
VFQDSLAQAKTGKVLQLAVLEKSKAKPFKGNYALLTGNYGVICTWYAEKSKHYYKVCEKPDFNYYHVTNYVRTITKGCLLTHQTGETPLGFQPTVLDVEDSFTLTEPCADYIKHHITMLVQGQVSLLCI